MNQRYAGQGLQIIAINLDTEEPLAKIFLEKVSAQIRIIYDPEGNIATDYQLLSMPSSYLIDNKGKICFTHKGFFSSKEWRLELSLVSIQCLN